MSCLSGTWIDIGSVDGSDEGEGKQDMYRKRDSVNYSDISDFDFDQTEPSVDDTPRMYLEPEPVLEPAPEPGVPREPELEPAAPAPCTYTVDPNARLTIASKVPYAVRVIVLVVGLLMTLVVAASYLWHLPLMVGRSALCRRFARKERFVWTNGRCFLLGWICASEVYCPDF